jgi:hypothetical protein
VKFEEKYEVVKIILEEGRSPYKDTNWRPGRFWR